MGKGERRGWTMVLVGMILMGMVEGHIRLTYPPARKYQFDFLDNARTPGPCGMPAGLDGRRTMLQAGSTLDIHWHLSYPHKGGYFFEVRSQTDAVLARYPATDFVGTEDGTSLNYSVALPSEPCENCTFRMVRQAKEWGPNYLFWSCSDISIVPVVADSYYCSGNGVMQGGACVCNRLYKGDKCQFKEECEADSDCGSNGMCVDTRATSYPIHQCYCRQGWFGSRCEKKSSVTTKPTDMGVYTSRVLSTKNEVTVYYRIVGSEVEVMVRAKTATWMGFGWRPINAEKTCQNFPDLKDDKYKMAEPEAESHPEGKGEAEGESKPEGEGLAETKPEGEWTAETKPEGTAEVTAEPKPEGTAEGEGTAETGGTTETKPEGETKPESTAEVHPEGEPSTNATAEAEGTVDVQPEGTAEDSTKAEGYPESHAEGEAEAYPEGESEGHPEGEAEGHAEGEAEGEAESSSRMHPMDCTDIVIGSAKGGYSRIGDYYTRDRSTPVHDEYLGGENSLTAGLVWEEQDYTVMLFRKKLKAEHQTDHSLKNEVTHVLWAIGQKKDANGQYSHFPNSALENPHSIPDFYREDELKYHGHQGQRGAASFNFYPAEVKKDDDNCKRGTCSAKTCGLDFSWVYDEDRDLITFNISAKFVENDQWIALGFSDNTVMEDSDVIFGGMSDGKPFIRDGWLYAKSAPRIDPQQDARLVSGGRTDSGTFLVFSRKRMTGDSENDIDLSQCRYVFFANRGGKISSPDVILKHRGKPIVSPVKICFGFCEKDVTYATRATARFPGFEYREAFSNPDSDDFKQTAKKLTVELEKLLKPKLGPSFKKVTVVELRKGSLIVVFEVQTQAKATVTQADVEQQVKTAIQSLDKQTVEGYGALELRDVAPTYRVDDSVDRQPSESPLTETEIIIIAIVLALVLVAVLIGLCKFLEARRARQQDKQRVMGGESASQSSTSKGKMTYGEFMATSANGGEPMAQNGSSGYPAFVNPGYDSAGYKMAP